MVVDESVVNAVGVDEIAAISEGTIALLNVASTLFGFIFVVLLLIPLQLFGAMCKFTLILIWAIPILNKFLAKL